MTPSLGKCVPLLDRQALHRPFQDQDQDLKLQSVRHRDEAT